jgi:hypothetical protein
MNWLNAVLVCGTALLSFGCAASRVVQLGTSLDSEFVGSTPCNALLRDFLRIPSNAPCECIRWQLMLHAGDVTGSRGAYALVTVHGIAETNGTGFFQGGSKTETRGQWRTTVNEPPNSRSMAYQLQAADPHRSLSLVKIDENLLHLLTSNGRLMVGNDSWSYTLNRMPKQHE